MWDRNEEVSKCFHTIWSKNRICINILGEDSLQPISDILANLILINLILISGGLQN